MDEPISPSAQSTEDNAKPAMTLPGHTRRFRHRNELARDRDVFKTLGAWRQIYEVDKIDPDEDISSDIRSAAEATPAVQVCPDKVLSSLAQLCTFKLDTRACMVSLTCSKNEFVLADVSRTTPLQHRSVTPAGAAACGIGTTSFKRTEGLSATAVDLWQSARRPRETVNDESEEIITSGCTPHWLMLDDLQEHITSGVNIGQRGFVSMVPWARFVCSVPLRTGEGSVIGALTILDDKPRSGLTAGDFSTLEDLSDTVIQHLYGTITRTQQQRSQLLLRGITSFNAGIDSLREWWQLQDDRKTQSKGRNTERITDDARSKRADQEFGIQSPSLKDADAVQQEVVSADNKSIDGKNEVLRPAHPARTLTTQLEMSTQDQINAAYDRATTLLREALGASSTAVIDLNVSFQAQQSSSSSSGDSSGSEDDLMKDLQEGNQLCVIRSISSRQREDDGTSRTTDDTISVTQTTLRHLVKAYPHGSAFYFGADGRTQVGSDGDTESSSNSAKRRRRIDRNARKAMDTLAKALPGVRSAVMFPIWDFTNERWGSCILAWSVDAARTLDASETLMYLQTFGHSLSNEVARLQSVAADKAKSRFISTVSHELRSPLHAILGGVDFLQDTELNSFQQEMTNTIEMAGRTLLDTVNHILDYSKISNATRSSRGDRSRQHSGDESEPAVVDLAELTESTVETCVSAHRSQMNLRRSSSASLAGMDLVTSKAGHEVQTKDIAITLNIAYTPTWSTEMRAGAWTRILTNLVGNALKYTLHGQIAVSLDVDLQETNDKHKKNAIVRLTVEDTGIGMSKTFMNDSAFVPFKQQDPHSTGAGLGLSIVKRIASDIGADLDLISEQGQGTKVTLFVPANVVPDRSERQMVVDCFQLHTSTTTDDASLVDTDRSIVKSVADTARSWLKADVVTSMQVEDAQGKTSVSAITEKTLKGLQQANPDELKNILGKLSGQRSHILVLANNIASMRPDPAFEELGIGVVFLHQPIGPLKLLRAIATDRDSTVAGTGPDTLGLSTSDHRPAEDARWQHSLSPRTVLSPEAAPQSEASLRTHRESEAGSKASTDTAATSALEGDRRTVLLVEDNHINMQLLVALVRKLKLPYLRAANGLEAVNSYRQNQAAIALILMDMSMPIMDGFEATRKIREVETKQGQSPVYIAALTGVTDAESKAAAFDCGVNEFHSKPVGMKELKVLMAKVNARISEADETTSESVLS